MSQADFHRDSPDSDVARSASASPPFPSNDGDAFPLPPPASGPPPLNPPAHPATQQPEPLPPAPHPPATTRPPAVSQAAAVPDSPAPHDAAVNTRAGMSLPPVVPPPPPPRATLVPVRSADATIPETGVGSAKGVRWRGELTDVSKPKIPLNGGSAKPIASVSPAASQPAAGNVAAASAPISSDSSADEPADTIPSDRITREAPPWLISMVIHLAVLLMLALITTPAGESLGSLMLVIGQSEQENDLELIEFTIASDPINVEAENEIDSEAEIDVQLDTEVELDMSTIFEAVDDPTTSKFAAVDVGLDSGMVAVGKPMFGGRSGAMKQALLAMYGGTPKTQEAVKLGLQWLKRNQLKDGSWSMKGPYRDGCHGENHTAATAMALLAFLGDGHTHKSGEYTDEVDRAIRYLIKQQDRAGFFARKAPDHERMYAQAQATIAICELYGMTRDSWLRPRAQLAIDFAQDSQSREGGWRYRPKFDSDTSMTGWFVMALQSGRSAGLDVNKGKLDGVGYFLDSVAAYDGAAYSYQPNGAPSPAMTAEGLLCRQYLGWPRELVPLKRGVEALALDYPFDIADHDVYYWYYATQVLHHYGGEPWKEWNTVMRVELPDAQIITGRERGSWAPQSDEYGSFYGRLYTTCLSLYCMEVYYRHMPLYQIDSDRPADDSPMLIDDQQDSDDEPSNDDDSMAGFFDDGAAS